MNEVHADAYSLIEEMETFVATPYPDHGGRDAQGFGHSVGPPEIVPGSTWTIDYAREVLRADCEIRATPFRKWLKDNGDIQLHDRAFGACVSLIFNRGFANFKKTQVAHFIIHPEISNHLIKAGCAFVEEENMRAKDKDTGIVRVFLGLKMRRIKEASLFLTKV